MDPVCVHTFIIILDFQCFEYCYQTRFAIKYNQWLTKVNETHYHRPKITSINEYNKLFSNENSKIPFI